MEFLHHAAPVPERQDPSLFLSRQSYFPAVATTVQDFLLRTEAQPPVSPMIHIPRESLLYRTVQCIRTALPPEHPIQSSFFHEPQNLHSLFRLYPKRSLSESDPDNRLRWSRSGLLLPVGGS